MKTAKLTLLFASFLPGLYFTIQLLFYVLSKSATIVETTINVSGKIGGALHGFY